MRSFSEAFRVARRPLSGGAITWRNDGEGLGLTEAASKCAAGCAERASATVKRMVSNRADILLLAFTRIADSNVPQAAKLAKKPARERAQARLETVADRSIVR